MHFAAVCGYVDIMELLLQKGAGVQLRDVNGNTPLHLAVFSKHIPAVMCLLNAGADLDVYDKFHKSPLDLVQSRLQMLRVNVGLIESEDRTFQLQELISLLKVCRASHPRQRVRMQISPLASIPESANQSLEDLSLALSNTKVTDNSSAVIDQLQEMLSKFNVS